MATSSPKAGDFTGRQRAKLAKEHAEEVAKRSHELGMIQAAEAAQAESEVIDLTSGQARVMSDDEVKAIEETVLDEVSDLGVGLADDSVVIRVNEDIEDMTFGVGNHLNFVAGRKYKVSRSLAQHLEEKGRIWH